MTEFCAKVQKPYFGIFGPFFPIFWKMRLLPKNLALSLFSVYAKYLKKLMSQFQENGSMDGREFIGPIRLKTGGPILFGNF